MIEEIKIDRLEELIQEMMRKIRDTYPTESREGNPITFDNGAATPLVKCITQIQGSQSGSGTPSPDNVRPIVAYSEGKIDVYAKNLWNEDYTGISTTVIYKQLKVGNGSFTLSTDNPQVIFGVDNLFIRGGYVTSGMTSIDDGVHLNAPRTVNSIDGYVTVGFRFYNGTTSPANSHTQLEAGTTPSAYEHYTSKAYTTSYSPAIYKGNEDVISGKVTAEMVVIDLGDLTWSLVSGSVFTAEISDMVAGLTPTEWNSRDVIICSSYNKCDAAVLENGDIRARFDELSKNSIAIKDERYTDADDFAAAVDGVKLAYELATPTTTTETVSNAPVSSIHGFNTIVSSTGDIEVTYITEEFEPLANVPAES